MLLTCVVSATLLWAQGGLILCGRDEMRLVKKWLMAETQRLGARMMKAATQTCILRYVNVGIALHTPLRSTLAADVLSLSLFTQ